MLSENAKEAYEACLRSTKENVFVTPSDNAMTSENMWISIEVRPYPVQTTFSAKVSAVNADIAADDKSFSMAPGDKRNIVLKRDLTKTLIVNVQVGGESTIVSLPAQEPYVYKRELRYSRTTTKYGHPSDEDHDTHQICVQLDADDDAVIIPNTAHLTRIIDSEQGITFSTNQVGNYNSRQVCLAGAENVHVNNANLNVCGYLTTEVLARIPRGSNESTKAKEPA
jgi:hypothetical protein